MKQNKHSVSVFLLSLLFSTLVSFFCQMCLVDAFSLPVSVPTLFVCCFLAGVLCTVIFLFRRSGWISLFGLILGLAAILWFRGPLQQHGWGFLYAVTKLYAKAFPNLQPVGFSVGDCTAIPALLAVPMAWFTARTICREGSVLLVLLGSVPTLLLCLILVDIAPILWLVAFTGTMLVLLVSQHVRDRSSEEGSYLTWWLILPVSLLIAGIVYLSPPAEYQRSDWSYALQAVAENQFSLDGLRTPFSDLIYRWNPSLRKVDLSAIGPRERTGRAVFRYSADTKLSLLRGVSLGVYKDNLWEAVAEDQYEALNLHMNPLTMQEAQPGEPVYAVKLQTHADHANLFTPYGMLYPPSGASAMDDAYIKNPDRRTAYSVYYQSEYNRPAATDPEQLAIYEAFVHEAYTQIPAELAQALQQIILESGVSPAISAFSYPEQIARYVQTSAVYDLDTPQIPDGEDFVLYFLQESNRGYCVHFASATVLLLRSQGIPARYVSGFRLTGPASTWNTVTEDDAHAWVEYYMDGIGWMPLDPTPADTGTVTGSVTRPDTPDEPEPVEPDEPEDRPEQTPTAPVNPNPQKPVQSPLAPQTPAAESVCLLWLLWLLLPDVLIGLIVLRRILVLNVRKKWFAAGKSPNRQALVMWQLLVSMGKKTGHDLPDAVFALAEKAKFSQHTLTPEELLVFRRAITEQTAILKYRSWYRKLWYRYGLILY